MKKWTKPQYGISHYGELRDERRSTVTRVGDLWVLTRWERARPFSSREEIFEAEDDARRAGEIWANGEITEGVCPTCGAKK